MTIIIIIIIIIIIRYLDMGDADLDVEKTEARIR